MKSFLLTESNTWSILARNKHPQKLCWKFRNNSQENNHQWIFKIKLKTIAGVFLNFHKVFTNNYCFEHMAICLSLNATLKYLREQSGKAELSSIPYLLSQIYALTFNITWGFFNVVWGWLCFNYRSSQRMCSIDKSVFKTFTKFKGKHLCQSLFFNKVAGLRPAKSLWHRCFPVNFVKVLAKNTYFTEHLRANASYHFCKYTLSKIFQSKFYQKISAKLIKPFNAWL